MNNTTNNKDKLRLYRVIQLKWNKFWHYFSDQQEPYEVRCVSFFSWYMDILIYSFQKFQQVLHNFHRLMCLSARIWIFVKIYWILRIKHMSVSFCEYICKESLDIHETLCGGQLHSCEFKFRILWRSVDKCKRTSCKHLAPILSRVQALTTHVRAFVHGSSWNLKLKFTRY